MLATIHVARNQRYSAHNMAEKAYTNDRLMHREGARLIQLNDIAHFVHFIVKFQLNPLKSRKTNQWNLKNFTISTLELDCEEQFSSTKHNVVHTFDYVEIVCIDLTTYTLYWTYSRNVFLPCVKRCELVCEKV